MADDPTVTSQQPSRRLALAYLALFGPPDKRSSDQTLVMADLESHCYAYRLVTEFKGAGDPSAELALFNDGRRSVWLRIRGQVIRAITEAKPNKISRKKTNPT